MVHPQRRQYSAFLAPYGGFHTCLCLWKHWGVAHLLSFPLIVHPCFLILLWPFLFMIIICTTLSLLFPSSTGLPPLIYISSRILERRNMLWIRGMVLAGMEWPVVFIHTSYKPARCLPPVRLDFPSFVVVYVVHFSFLSLWLSPSGVCIKIAYRRKRGFSISHHGKISYGVVILLWHSFKFAHLWNDIDTHLFRQVFE